jgi:formylglycine-generating enzyme required for sulfatase activity
MLRRNVALGIASVSLVSLAGLISIKVRAQAPQPASGTAPSTPEMPYDWKASFAKVPTGKVPRMPDGKPDLQGIWSRSILTPVERPSTEHKTEISAAEVEEDEDAAQQSAIKLRVESTITPPGEKSTDAYNSFWRDGYWYKVPMTVLHTSQVVDPLDGKIPPLTAAARERRDFDTMRLNRPATGPEDRPLSSRCVRPEGVGPAFTGSGPGGQESTFEIIQGPEAVIVRVEALESQMIYLDGRPRPPENVHLYQGAARGHWEGDTLVVDYTNFKDLGTRDGTEKMHVVERWKRLDDSHMLYGFTMDDPGTWTKPWSVEYVMWRLTNQEQLVEYACHEGNVGVEFTLSAARTKEKEAAEAKEKERAKVAALASPSDAVQAQTSAPIHLSIAPTAVAFSSNALGMEFAMIPPGEFPMGCSERTKAIECSSDERPRHPVQITKAFEIQRTEVTQKQWQAVMGANPSFHRGDVNFPVEQVTFEQVQDFLTKLNARNDGFVYRLPTDAEWEYAARAGTTDPYSGPLDDQEFPRGDHGDRETYPVANKKPNTWGIYDIHGNVLEWVQDWYDPSYYSDSPSVDPKGPATGDLRVVRGASFRGYSRQYYPLLMRVSVRNKFPEAYEFYDLGFRVVREKR